MKNPEIKFLEKETIKVLIVAQNASSRFGGEASLPLRYFKILKERRYSVKMIAHSRNRTDLQETLGPFIDDILFVEDSIYHRVIWNVGKIFPQRIEEILFGNILNLINEIYQGRIIRQLVDQGLVDIIHQPIPVSPRAPSTLHNFGVPVIIGPMNGGMSYPPGYEEYESRTARILVRLARGAAVFLNWIIPGKRRAAALLVANERTRNALPIPRHPRTILLVENGVDLSTWKNPEVDQNQCADPVFRLVFMGRLVKWKAVDITLEALSLARKSGIDVELQIIGDGPERARLEALSSALELDKNVIFSGFKKQSECLSILNKSDALILNSVWECGGAVVLEAMSVGLPVIAADWGGPADYVDATCGVLVSPIPRNSFSNRLAEAIAFLEKYGDRRRHMGAAGAERVRNLFDWNKKVDRIVEIYGESI